MKFLKILTLAVLIGGAGGLAKAQTPIAAKVYGLTNANTFTISTGGTNMATAALTTINSNPFPIYRGRGFAYQLEFVGTNSTTALVTPFFQFATPGTNAGSLTTNWSQYVPGTGIAANGTTRVYGYGLVPPTTVDNCTLGRLAVVSNAHSASVILSSTNTFVEVFP